MRNQDYYCVLNIQTGSELYPAGDKGDSETKAASALVCGTCYGKGSSPEQAKGQAHEKRAFHLGLIN